MDARKQFLVIVCVVAAGVTAGTATGTGDRPRGKLAIVQAVPDVRMAIAVDGEDVRERAADGAVIGPLALPPGQHEVSFTFDGGRVVATVGVDPGRSSDVVVHQPPELGGDPVVSVFPTADEPIAPGKARVVLAHTATTAPADVEVDGKVVFTNIANGEYAQAEVAAGRHRVALVPSGVDAAPILGPLEVDLKAGTLTTVYAMGNPTAVKAIVREIALAGNGHGAPARLDTGSAGLVADVDVHTFGSGGGRS